MIEVEAKVNVNSWMKGDIARIREILSNIGRYKGVVKKRDNYYTLQKIGGYPTKSLRIRKIGRKYQINFKRRLSYFRGVHAKQEKEFSASSIGDFLKLIEDFGFRKWLVKEKTSEIYEIKKNFSIELNEVKKLGWFLEIEFLCRKARDITTARKEIISVIRELGIKDRDLVKEGYTKMLWDKNHR